MDFLVSLFLLRQSAAMRASISAWRRSHRSANSAHTRANGWRVLFSAASRHKLPGSARLQGQALIRVGAALAWPIRTRGEWPVASPMSQR